MYSKKPVLKAKNKHLLQVYLAYQRSQCKIDAFTKFSNISISERAKT